MQKLFKLFCDYFLILNCNSKYQKAHSISQKHFCLAVKDEALKALETCLKINPSSICSVGTVGFGMACIGEYDRALGLLEKYLLLNSHCPWWFHLGFFLIYYKKRMWLKAYQHAQLVNAEVFLDPFIKAVSSFKCGKNNEASIEQKRLHVHYPELSQNLDGFLSIFILDQEIISDMVYDLNAVN